MKSHEIALFRYIFGRFSAWQRLTVVEEDQATTVLVVSKHVQPDHAIGKP